MKHTRDDVTHANTVYHNAIADQYDERLEGSHPAVLERYREIFDRYVLPRVPSGRVLDFGCGTGWLEALLSEGAHDVTGIDISEGMLRRARARFPNVRFVQGDLYTHTFDGQYDLVMEKAVLHHLLDWEALVDRMADLTAPGGTLFIGNEPSSFAYRALAPLKTLFRLTVNRNRTKSAEQLLGDADYEALSEYHLFYASGFNPLRVRRRLLDRGFREVKLFFSLRELFASLEERWSWLRLNAVAPSLLVDHFPLSRNFDLVAYK